MICFPNCKINIGLNITEKRKDGFHNLETVFYPINLKETLEFVEQDSINKKTVFTSSGIKIEGNSTDNICLKAYNLIKEKYSLPELNIHLHKSIPIGAGLGGGSADGAYMIKYLNQYFNLNITIEEQEKLAAQLGSDCAFFIKNKPVFAYGRGELFKEITFDLNNYSIIMIKPDIHISTAEAYSNIKPKFPLISVKEAILKPISEWKHCISNDFEESIFPKYGYLKELKQELYNKGALYAAMSGSGSTIYGIFDKYIHTDQFKINNNFVWKGDL